MYLKTGQDVLSKVQEIVTSARKSKVSPIRPLGLIVLDLDLPGKSGLETLSEIQSYYSSLAVLTGSNASQT